MTRFKTLIKTMIDRTIIWLSPNIKAYFIRRLWELDTRLVYKVICPYFTESRCMDDATAVLPVAQDQLIGFENLVDIFSSNPFNSGSILMTIRDTAYIFGVTRNIRATKVIEIGRYRGGSTLVIAAALGSVTNTTRPQLWSIDLGPDENMSTRPEWRNSDEQLETKLNDLGLMEQVDITLLVGDSREVSIETGEIDIAFIDGDHSYEGVKSDFERFGIRVKVGGSIFFDDCYRYGQFGNAPNYSRLTKNKRFGRESGVTKLVSELLTSENYQLVKAIDRLAHVQRIA